MNNYTINPLVWGQPGPNDFEHTVICASTIFGEYRVGDAGNGEFTWNIFDGRSWVAPPNRKFSSVKATKEDAEAHYQRRLMFALTIVERT